MLASGTFWALATLRLMGFSFPRPGRLFKLIGISRIEVMAAISPGAVKSDKSLREMISNGVLKTKSESLWRFCACRFEFVPYS